MSKRSKPGPCLALALGGVLALGCGAEEDRARDSPALDGGSDTGGASGAPGQPDAIAPTDAAESDAPSIPPGPTPAPDGEPYATLSEWNLFSDGPNQVPSEGVVPFEVISVLFADNASKQRFLWIPPGTEIGWSDEGEWSVPVGAIAVKTFYFPVDARDPAQGVRLVETRLLVHEADRWVGHVYVWNEEQTEAARLSTGTTATVSWTNEAGESLDQAYSIPDLNQCQQCHGEGAEMHLLGPRTRQLDRDNDYGNGLENQLDYMASLGWFDADPPRDARAPRRSLRQRLTRRACPIVLRFELRPLPQRRRPGALDELPRRLREHRPRHGRSQQLGRLQVPYFGRRRLRRSHVRRRSRRSGPIHPRLPPRVHRARHQDAADPHAALRPSRRLAHAGMDREHAAGELFFVGRRRRCRRRRW